MNQFVIIANYPIRVVPEIKNSSKPISSNIDIFKLSASLRYLYGVSAIQGRHELSKSDIFKIVLVVPEL